MKNLNTKKNNPGVSQTSIGLALDKHEKALKNSQDEGAMVILKDNFRLNSTGTDNDLANDIQDALGREGSLSLVLENIDVTAEGEVVTLEGKVSTQQEKITAGDIAITFAGEDNVNNDLTVVNRAR
jgi:osmotically-inducible protein OsmY